MAGPLYRLVYCSRNGGTSSENLAREVEAILEPARRRNEGAGLTGALLASASGFAQVLEGPREAIDQAFQRISADPRHADVSVLTFAPAPRRLFPDAPLAFCGDFRAGALDPLAGILADTTRGDDRAMTGGDLLRLLVRLVRADRDWAA
ncbi:MAG: BLUF domain-containing protein [Acetobacteraceae bacterium]|nr:BLUF domain-containing protein [Pseudomonadota bacterium]